MHHVPSSLMRLAQIADCPSYRGNNHFRTSRASLKSTDRFQQAPASSKHVLHTAGGATVLMPFLAWSAESRKTQHTTQQAPSSPNKSGGHPKSAVGSPRAPPLHRLHVASVSERLRNASGGSAGTMTEHKPAQSSATKNIHSAGLMKYQRGGAAAVKFHPRPAHLSALATAGVHSAVKA